MPTVAPVFGAGFDFKPVNGPASPPAFDIDAWGDRYQVFARIAERVRQVLEDFQDALSAESLNRLRSWFALEQHPNIDYDTDGPAFASAYFLSNYWKTLSTFLQEPPPLARDVIDVGAGSAATTVAYLAWLETELPASAWPVTIRLLDRSATQFRLAAQILQQVQRELRRVEVDPEHVCIDLLSWEPAPNSADVILFGHVLTENRSSTESLLDRAFTAVRAGGSIYVVERTDDPIWHEIGTSVTRLALPAIHGQIHVRIPPSEHLLGTHRADLASAHLVVRAPERKQLVRLLSRYFRAWETQSVELLLENFDDDAEYHERPYDEPPLRGHAEIAAYWHRTVLQQQQIRAYPCQVGFSATEVFAVWEARFLKGDQRVRLWGMMVLTLGSDRQRVRHLREIFRTWKSPEEILA